MDRIDLVRKLFEVETGLKAVTVSRIAFTTFMIEADNGCTYRFVV